MDSDGENGRSGLVNALQRSGSRVLKIFSSRPTSPSPQQSFDDDDAVTVVDDDDLGTTPRAAGMAPPLHLDEEDAAPAAPLLDPNPLPTARSIRSGGIT